jgi:anti-anti-sigma factor
MQLDGNRIAIDLRKVGFMDSVGLGVLIGARRRASADGVAVALICVDGPVRRVIDVAGLADVFTIVGSEDELT